MLSVLPISVRSGGRTTEIRQTRLLGIAWGVCAGDHHYTQTLPQDLEIKDIGFSHINTKRIIKQNYYL